VGVVDTLTGPDSEAGSYVSLINFVYHSTLGLRVMKKKKQKYNVSVQNTAWVLLTH